MIASTYFPYRVCALSMLFRAGRSVDRTLAMVFKVGIALRRVRGLGAGKSGGPVLLRRAGRGTLSRGVTRDEAIV